jgi:tetratricopeptide (TPR) repeat protein
MPASPLPEPAPQPDRGPPIPALGAVLVAATVAVYGRSFGGPFLYDDIDSIPGNPTLGHLWTALAPPLGGTVSGRPILNLSLALNHALSGTAVWSYHALNVLIHAAAALLLFGIVRRTLATEAAGARSPAQCRTLGFAAALLWAVHPLQTESVAYVVQRAESLMGFFYLLMLYSFIRSAEPGSRRAPWAVLSVTACLLGMGCKEVMATAPLVVLLYDRAFVGRSFGAAWTRRKSLYLAYAACWVPLALWVAHTAGRGGTAGFGSGVPWLAYLLTQFKAVATYLRLSLWPSPLVADYGRILEGDRRVVAACALLLLALAAETVRLLRRNAPLGFLGAWFFLILAPTSSVIPVSTEIMAEHRMYLPLAAVVVLAVLALQALLGWRPFLAAVTVLALGLGLLAARRTAVYASAFAFWSDVAAKVPGNAGAWNNLGILLAGRGEQAAAIEHYERALAIAPAYAYAHYNLGNSLVATGRVDEAIGHFEEALRFRPEDPAIHFGLGNALAREKREAAAAAQFLEVLRLDPARADAWLDLGEARVDSGDLAGAEEAYARAARLRPEDADARVNHGNVLAELGRLPEAVAEFREALRLEPGAADVHNNLGSLLAGSGRLAEAEAEYEEALRLKPDYPEARDNLSRVRALEAAAPR